MKHCMKHRIATKLWTVAVVAVLGLVVPGLAVAHQGHTHKVLGTVTSLDDPHFDIKGTDGKTVTIMIDASTVITRGKEKIDAGLLKLGDRVSIEAKQVKDMMMAQTIKVGAAPPAKAAKK
jgi:hypothetical protein